MASLIIIIGDDDPSSHPEPRRYVLCIHMRPTPLNSATEHRPFSLLQQLLSMAGLFAPTSSGLDPTTDPTYNLSTAPAGANGPIPSPKSRYGKPLPDSWVPLYQKPMRTPMRRLRVVTIGAGVSGMGFAYKLQHAHRLTESNGDEIGPMVEHTIYEANKDLGGTWLVNTYPGVACDVPAHVYTFPFEVSACLSWLQAGRS